jgi:Skp family chaperone for outer membrane proteins
MKKIRLFIVGLVIVAFSALSILAQTPAATQPSKIGLINTLAFGDAKAGITKYSTAMNGVDAIFKGELDGLKTMVTRLQTLETELTTLQKQLSTATPGAAATQMQTSYNTKVEEYDKLGREYKFKQEDIRTRYQRRRQEVMGPILLDIGKAMQEFARQRGYTMMFDASKLDEGGVLLTLDEKADVTKDFITFYNARPATAATTTPVK